MKPPVLQAFIYEAFSSLYPCVYGATSLTGRIYVEEKKSWRSVTDKFESGKKINPDSTRPCLQVVENNSCSNIMALLVLWRPTRLDCVV